MSRRHRGRDDDAASRGEGDPHGQSTIRSRPEPDVDLSPTRVKHARPPSRSFIEGDEDGAPTGLRNIEDLDDLTSVKSPQALMAEAEAHAAAPTQVRHAHRVRGGAMPSPIGEDDDEVPDSLPPPSGSSALVGTQIGQCQIGPAFASGGMATVHLGRWRGGGGFAKTVAVKRLHQNYATDPDFVSMLLDEARMVARIQHGNVTSVLDVVEGDDELFIVMDFVNGVTLAHLVRQMKREKGMIPIPIAMRIVSGILHGLQAAHDASDERGQALGIIHRDVSPENVLVGADGSVQLIDFGVAKALGRGTESVDGQIKGKLHYSSPEQLRGEQLDGSSDIYAASICLWEVACGRKLYQGDNAGAVVWEILESTPPLPSLMRDGLTEAFDEIVLRGLNPDAKGRWFSAADMAEALERCGPMATQREVSDWVKSVAKAKLALLNGALQQAETMIPVSAPPPVSVPPVSVPPVSVPPVSVPPVSAVPSAPPATSAPPAPAQRGVGLWLAAVAVVAIGGTAIGFLAGRDDAPAPPEAAPKETPAAKTVLVPVPVPVPAPAPEPPTPEPPAPEPPAPEPSASAAPSVEPSAAAPPPVVRPRRPWPRPKPKKKRPNWIPDDI